MTFPKWFKDKTQASSSFLLSSCFPKKKSKFPNISIFLLVASFLLAAAEKEEEERKKRERERKTESVRSSTVDSGATK